MAATHPFKISIRILTEKTSPIEFTNLLANIEKWLESNINRDSYLAFTNADWMHCFFSNEEDAILCKLTWD